MCSIIGNMVISKAKIAAQCNPLYIINVLRNPHAPACMNCLFKGHLFALCNVPQKLPDGRTDEVFTGVDELLTSDVQVTA